MTEIVIEENRCIVTMGMISYSQCYICKGKCEGFFESRAGGAIPACDNKECVPLIQGHIQWHNAKSGIYLLPKDHPFRSLKDEKLLIRRSSGEIEGDWEMTSNTELRARNQNLYIQFSNSVGSTRFSAITDLIDLNQTVFSKFAGKTKQEIVSWLSLSWAEIVPNLYREPFDSGIEIVADRISKIK